MDEEEVVELCEEFFNDLEGEEDYWLEVRGKSRPAFKLVEVEVESERIVLVVEAAPGIDPEESELSELLDRAVAALSDEHEELSDFRIGHRFDEE